MFLHSNPLALFASYPFLLFVLIAVSLVFGGVIATLAMRKGYSFAAWLGAGGLVLVAAIALGFLPNARDPSLSSSQRSRLRARGNGVGTALSLLTVLLAFFVILARLLSFPVTNDADRSDFFEQLYMPASQFMTWIQLLTYLVALSAYVMRPRGMKSPLVVGSLLTLVLVHVFFSVASVVERKPFMAELPAQLVYSTHYLVRVLYYFGLTGLCLGVLGARPTTDAAGV